MSKKNDSNFFDHLIDKYGGVLLYTVIFVVILILANWRSITSTWNSWMDSREKAKLESLHNDYVKACEKYNFEKAYKIVNKIKTIDKHKNPKHEKYVVLHEATYVLENEGVNGLTHISFIAKEHNAGWVYKEILGLAKSMSNDDLTLQILKTWNLWDDAIIQKLLDEGNKSDAMAILRNAGSFGLPAINTELGFNKDETGISEKITRYNSHCRYIVDYAISHKDKDLAYNALLAMKKNLYVDGVGRVKRYTEEDKKAVQETIENAEKLGLFK